MPTYQYSCTECGHFFEQVQSFSDASLTECPACQGKLRKVFNAVGVVFKGSGFYRTDSRSENGGKATAGAGAAGGSKDGAKSGGGKDGAKDGGSRDGGSSKDAGSGASSSTASSNGAGTGSSSSSSGTSTSGSAA